MNRFAPIILLVSFTLLGCAPSRDPSEVGLLGATYNLVGGVYEEDDAKIRREIEALEARRLLLEDEADRLAAEAERLSGQRRAKAERLSKLNAETAAMNARLSELSRLKGQNEARVAALREQERSLTNEVIAAGSGNASESEIANLEAKRVRLLSEIEALIATG